MLAAAEHFDSAGFTVAFAVGACVTVYLAVMYRRELARKQRPYYLFRYRFGLIGAGFLLALTALRLFVFHA